MEFQMTQRLSDVIRENMKAEGKRFWAGDNISDQLTESLKEELIKKNY